MKIFKIFNFWVLFLKRFIFEFWTILSPDTSPIDSIFFSVFFLNAFVEAVFSLSNWCHDKWKVPFSCFRSVFLWVSSMHYFTISICEAVSQFNENLMTQFDPCPLHKGSSTIKVSESEKKRSNVKTGCNHWKIKYVRQIICTSTRGIFLQKLHLLLTLLNRSFSVMLQL